MSACEDPFCGLPDGSGSSRRCESCRAPKPVGEFERITQFGRFIVDQGLGKDFHREIAAAGGLVGMDDHQVLLADAYALGATAAVALQQGRRNDDTNDGFASVMRSTARKLAQGDPHELEALWQEQHAGLADHV